MLPGRSYTFDDIVAMARRRAFIVAVPVLMAGVATLAVLDRWPNKYRSSTTIMVVPQSVPESYVKATVTTRVEDRMQSLSQQLLSRTRLERIILDLNLYQLDRGRLPMEDVVERMRANIDVQMVKGDAFRVSYVADTPAFAQQVTERLTSLFIEESLKGREVLAEATNEFIETQLEDARRRLVLQEKQLEQYRVEHSGQLPSQLQSNLQASQNLQAQEQTLVDSINRDRDRRLLLERTAMDVQATGDAPQPQGPADEPDAVAKRLQAAREALAEMETRMTPRHPDLMVARQVVRDLEAELAARPAAPAPATPAAAAMNEASRQRRLESLAAEIKIVDGQMAEKEGRRRAITEQIATYGTRIAAVPARESELASLTRDYETMQRVYSDLLSKREQSQVAANLERRQIGEQFAVLDPARLPEKPFSPNRPLILLSGLALGLALGAGLAGFLEFRDTSLRSEADVIAALNLPLLGLVPNIETVSDRRWRHARLAAVSLGATALLVVTVFVVWRFTGINL